MSKKLFITGTGTDIGKTFVTGLILKKLNENGLNPAYFKAAMSGNERRADGRLIPGDALCVKDVSGIKQPIEEMCPYVYENAVSPHLAAQMEGNPVEMDRVLRDFDVVCHKYDYVTAEGSGGILCPLRFDEQKIQIIDFIKARNFDCLIVADAGLGTINSVGLAAEYMKEKNISVKGIILNNFIHGNILHEDNLKMCEYITGLNVIARVKSGAENLDISLDMLKSFYE